MKMALFVIDVQNEFFDISPTTAQSLTDAIEYINAAIALFREKELPVICVQDVDEENGRLPNSTNFATPDTLHILPTDLHIHKKYGNAFNKTTLATDLQNMGVDTVIITGFSAEYCILSTYRGAEDVDLTPIILRGSLASATPAHINFVETINNVLSYGVLEKLLSPS